MYALVTSLFILGAVVATILTFASAPSLREAIRRAAPEQEAKYFSSSQVRRIHLAGLRQIELFSRPPAVLESSAEFLSSLRLVRVLVLAIVSFAVSLVVFVLVT